MYPHFWMTSATPWIAYNCSLLFSILKFFHKICRSLSLPLKFTPLLYMCKDSCKRYLMWIILTFMSESGFAGEGSALCLKYWTMRDQISCECCNTLLTFHWINDDFFELRRRRLKKIGHCEFNMIWKVLLLTWLGTIWNNGMIWC